MSRQYKRGPHPHHAVACTLQERLQTEPLHSEHLVCEELHDTCVQNFSQYGHGQRFLRSIALIELCFCTVIAPLFQNNNNLVLLSPTTRTGAPCAPRGHCSFLDRAP